MNACRRRMRYASIAPPTGIPMRVRQSKLTTPFVESPIMLIARIQNAVHQPQRAMRQRPMEAVVQAPQTNTIRRTAHSPSPASPSRTRGFSRHKASRIVWGKRSIKAVRALMTAPNIKKSERRVTPGKRFERIIEPKTTKSPDVPHVASHPASSANAPFVVIRAGGMLVPADGFGNSFPDLLPRIARFLFSVRTLQILPTDAVNSVSRRVSLTS